MAVLHFRKYHYLNVIQAMEDIALLLTHICEWNFAMHNDAAFTRVSENDMAHSKIIIHATTFQVACKIATLLLQYFYCTAFAFQCLEAFHIFTVLTNVVWLDEILIPLKYA